MKLFFTTLLAASSIFSVTKGQIVNPVHVSSFTRQSLTGAILENPTSVFVSGNFAYVTSFEKDALEIVDISNPEAPVHAGSLTNGSGGALLDGASAVSVRESFAYVASRMSHALEIIDISNPALPVHAASILNGDGGALLNSPTHVHLAGNYAYVISSVSNTLEIIDISNPLLPVHRGSLTHGAGDAALQNPQAISVKDGYAYITSLGSMALEIVDVSNPEMPVHATKFTGFFAGSINPASISINGDYAYVANTNTGFPSLDVINISNPFTPSFASRVSDPSFRVPAAVFSQGNFVYVVYTGSGAGTLEIFDASVPGMLVRKGALPDNTNGALIGTSPSLFVSSLRAFIVSSYDALEIANVSNENLPTHESNLVDGAGGPLSCQVSDVAASGNYAYMTNYGCHSLEVIDITDRSMPVHIASLDHSQAGAYLKFPKRISVVNNTGYILTDKFLEMIDLSNPVNPVQLTKQQLGFDLNSLSVANISSTFATGRFAFIVKGSSSPTDLNSSLFIVNVTNPASPQLIGNLSYGPLLNVLYPTGVFVYENRAYITSNRTNSLEIVDVKNPALPVTVGAFVDAPGSVLLYSPQAVHVSQGYAYVVGSEGMEIIDVSNPLAPSHKGSLQAGNGTAIFVSGKYAYITDRANNVLKVIDVANPAQPVFRGSLANDAGGAKLSSPESVSVSGDYIFVASSQSNAVEIAHFAPPAITSIIPALGGQEGATVTINGTNFSPTPANNVVKFNGVAATVTASTETSITTTIPQGATSGRISLSVAGFTTESQGVFRVIAPTITSPSSGGFGETIQLSTNLDGSTGSLTYSVVNVTGSATVAGNTLSLAAVGTVNVTANISGNTNYSAASASQIVTITPATQTINFGAIANKTFGDAPFNITASGGLSGNAVVFSSSNVSVATVSGNTVTIVGAGETSITANQAGNQNYLPAEPVSQTLVVNKVSQTITFQSIPNKKCNDPSFTLSASASSGLPVTFSSNNTGVAMVNGNVVTIVGPGTVKITASQSNPNYQAVSEERSFSVTRANQTVTFNPIGERAFGDAPFQLEATASSGLPITFSYNPGILSITGNTATIVGLGYTNIIATQTGNGCYNSAFANRSVVIGKGKPVITVSIPSDEFCFNAQPTMTFSSSNNGSVYCTTPGVILEGSTIRFQNPGSYSFTLKQNGDAFFDAAESGFFTIDVREAPTGVSISTDDNTTFWPGSWVRLTKTGIADSYQWLLNGIPIQGATSGSWDALQSGVYVLRYYENYPEVSCSALSNEITTLALSDADIIIFPNPANQSFTVELPLAMSSSVQIRVTTLMGQIKYTGSINSGQLTKQILCSSWTPGNYTVILTYNTGVIQKTVLVQH